jgi:hypothetical protein
MLKTNKPLRTRKLVDCANLLSGYKTFAYLLKTSQIILSSNRIMKLTIGIS